MIKVEAIKYFTLREFDKIKMISRKDKDRYGEVFEGDIFECDEKMAKYLTGGNEGGHIAVKIIEVVPNKKGR